MPDQMPPVSNEEDNYIRTFGPFVPLYTSYERIPIDTEDGLYLLGEWVKMTDAKLIVIDPLLAAISGRSLNDGWAARKSLTLLKEFCVNHQVTALVLHHTKRGYGGSGHRRVADSDQLAATASMDMVLMKDPLSGMDGRPYRATLSCRGRGDFANRIWRFESMDPLTYQLTSEAPFASSPEDVNDVEVAILLALGRGPQTLERIWEGMEPASRLSACRLWAILQDLQRKGLVAWIGKEGARHVYRLVRASEIPAPPPVRAEDAVLAALREGEATTEELWDRLTNVSIKPKTLYNVLHALMERGEVVRCGKRGRSHVLRVAR